MLVNKPSAYKLSNHGFLLVEHLIALVITALLTLLILRLFPFIQTYQVDLDEVTPEEITALRTQLQKEAQRTTYFEITQDKLLLHLDSGSTPAYFISNHRLMRQVSGKGGEVALYHCDKLELTQHNNQSITLTLHTKNNVYSIYLTSSLFPLNPLLEEKSEESEVLLDEPKRDDSSLNTSDEFNDCSSFTSPCLSD